jgi:hypothetical protein
VEIIIVFNATPTQNGTIDPEHGSRVKESDSERENEHLSERRPNKWAKASLKEPWLCSIQK